MTTLSIAKHGGEGPSYRPAQLLTVYFPDLDPTLGKPYSISSAPAEKALSITVKAMGRFSDRLCSLEPGESLLASRPYHGGLSQPISSHRTIMLAAGMGVAPFRGILLESIAQKHDRHFSLFHSGKHLHELLFAAELSELASCHHSIEVKHFVTQEEPLVSNVYPRRIQADDVLATLGAGSVEILVCGSVSFVQEQKASLIASGVHPSALRTEAHF